MSKYASGRHNDCTVILYDYVRMTTDEVIEKLNRTAKLEKALRDVIEDLTIRAYKDHEGMRVLGISAGVLMQADDLLNK